MNFLSIKTDDFSFGNCLKIQKARHFFYIFIKNFPVFEDVKQFYRSKYDLIYTLTTSSNPFTCHYHAFLPTSYEFYLFLLNYYIQLFSPIYTLLSDNLLGQEIYSCCHILKIGCFSLLQQLEN